MKETKGDKIAIGLINLIWAAIPASGFLSIMVLLKSPKYLAVGLSIIVFLLMGIFDRINEILNALKESKEEMK